MANSRRFEVFGSIGQVALPKTGAGATFESHGKGGKIGRLEVGRGTVRFTARCRRKVSEVALNWEQFSNLVDLIGDMGYGEAVRRLRGTACCVVTN